ncbi:MAG: hypothetical protein LBF05_00600 [Tannerella sp.]|nr:hypothetical protein [Tannerella sp.]
MKILAQEKKFPAQEIGKPCAGLLTNEPVAMICKAIDALTENYREVFVRSRFGAFINVQVAEKPDNLPSRRWNSASCKP